MRFGKGLDDFHDCLRASYAEFCLGWVMRSDDGDIHAG